MDSPAGVEKLLDEGLRLHGAGQLGEAEGLYRRVLAVNPNHADALHLLGVLAHQRGEHEAARGWIDRAVAIQGNDAAYYSNLGEVYRALGMHEAALAACQKALALWPDFVQAWVNMANVLHALGRGEEAERACLEVVGKNPGMGEAWNILGSIYQSRGSNEKAEEAYRRALGTNAGNAEAWNNLGTVLEKQGQWAAAEEAYGKAIGLRRGFSRAWCNLGICLQRRLTLTEAIGAFDEAIRMEPGMADAHWGLAIASLLRGDFSRGWAEYEWRWKYKKMEMPGAGRPMWKGESLEGKVIVLDTEQGFGDAIQFVRYAKLVAGRGARKVVLRCQRELTRLFEGMEGVVVIEQGAEVGDADVQCPLMSLPQVFGTMVETIPAETDYIKARDEWVKKFAELLGGGLAMPGRRVKRVGMVWAGRETHVDDARRSMKLEDFSPLFDASHVQFVSLQMGVARGQIRTLGAKLWDFSEHLTDFADTVGLIENLDLVITVDSAVAHLAGAMGKKTWVLLPWAPDWRWLLGRGDSPWYPTMRLFRQRKSGEWGAVVQEVRSALADL